MSNFFKKVEVAINVVLMDSWNNLSSWEADTCTYRPRVFILASCPLEEDHRDLVGWCACGCCEFRKPYSSTKLYCLPKSAC
uniref:Ovule protein n=1 Tax=Steinernema glaseri TaxID=37863 RepID=A0A1I7Z950_9BILA